MGLCVFSLFVSCSPRSLHEARSVVAEADSLWLEGGLYSDSAQLAQAYTTLEHWQRFYADDYAHACYHYGKLLRKHEDPVSAMRVFINATHSPSHDYHILGRVYSNMGSICHIAGNYSLAYEMYERSAELFLCNRDTLLYYYDLNNMAYEMAESGQKDVSYIILNKIEKECSCYNISVKMLETKANACKQVQQYDSTIYYARKLYGIGEPEPTTLILLAQAYSFIGKKDSATYYAKELLTGKASLSDLNNALYILTNDDETKSLDAVRQAAADRSDVQKLIEIRKGNLAQASLILHQELNKSPDWRRYVIILFVFVGIIAASVLPVLWKKRKEKMHRQVAAIADMQAENMIKSINTHIDVSDLNSTLHWKNYDSMKVNADLYMGGIVSKLESYRLNETEIRFCVLTILDFRQKQIAETIHYSYPSGLKTLKKRIADKLGTTTRELRDFLLHLLPQL